MPRRAPRAPRSYGEPGRELRVQVVVVGIAVAARRSRGAPRRTRPGAGARDRAPAAGPPRRGIPPSSPPHRRRRRAARSGSAGSSGGSGVPRSTSNASAQSSSVRAIGPTWSNDGASGQRPSAGTLPKAGLKPATPQAAAGSRIEAPVSVPRPSAQRPAASALALPPDDPPGMRSGRALLTTAP